MFTIRRSLALLSPLLLVPSALAGTLFVDVAQITGAGDGSSWANAFQGPGGLQAALTVAAPGDQVWVVSGTYLPTTTGSRLEFLRLESGVEIYGGFDGTETQLAQRDFVANPTVLSGDLNGDDAGAGSNAENSFHVLHGNGSDATALLDGFTVTAGHANDPASNRDRGAGILCLGINSPRVRNCRFQGNVATFGGGAGYLNNGAAPTFTDCAFDSNLGGSFGGAFDMASNVTATFERCSFTNNRAARAGAIEIFGASTVQVRDSLFVGNTATGANGGGGIWISGSNPVLRNCTVVANLAPAAVAAGIQIASGNPLIVNCVVDGNSGSAGSASSASQINPAGKNVTWTLVAAGYAGTGNSAAAPNFEGCGPHPFALAAGSPGVDAGDNAGVAPGSSSDLAGAARFFDVAGAPNSGAGLAPLVDMGAYETGFDCNANGVSDACDIALGTSLDLDLDDLPDECACSGGAAPVVYCTAKLNSQGCLSSISASGIASAGGSLAFPIRAANIINKTVGLLIYGFQPAATPFQGGFLCIGGQVVRTAGQPSGGSATGVDCTGSFTFDFNAYIASGANPALAQVGQQVNVQYWSRDPASPSTTNLTDALQFQVCQ